MAFRSVFMVTNSLRLRRFQPAVAAGGRRYRRRDRPERDGGDGRLEAVWHGGRAEPTGEEHRQQQPGRGLRVGAGAYLAVRLGAPDQVNQVRGDRADRIAGRAAQRGLSGQGGRVGEQHAIGGRRVVGSRAVRGPGQDVGEQPGRGAEIRGESIERCASYGGGTGTTLDRFRLNELVSQIAFGGRRGRVYRRIVSLAGVRPGDAVLESVGCSGGVSRAQAGRRGRAVRPRRRGRPLTGGDRLPRGAARRGHDVHRGHHAGPARA